MNNILLEKIIALENKINKQNIEIDNIKQTVSQMIQYLPSNDCSNEIKELMDSILFDDNDNIDNNNDDNSMSEKIEILSVEQDDVSNSDLMPNTIDLSGDDEDNDVSEHSSMPELIEISDDEEEEIDFEKASQNILNYKNILKNMGIFNNFQSSIYENNK